MTADNRSLIQNLISGREFSEPKFRTVIETLANDLYELNSQINIPERVSTGLFISEPVISVGAPTNFTATIFSNNIRLAWTAPGTDTFLYEIRLGADYDTATILLTTATLSADIDPVSRFIHTNSTYTFWVATIDNTGEHSIPASVTINIPAIGAPVLTATVIGNSVLLNWTIPFSTFTIAYYTVYRGGVFVGNINGTFHIILEQVAGTYSYDVEAWDIVNNVGPLSGVGNIVVSNPPDFLQFASLSSTFNGTKVNCFVDRFGFLFAIVDTAETWTNHFSSRGWASPQAQISAGYPLYFEPGLTSGSYEETFDFGTIVSAVIATVTYIVTNVAGSVAIQTEIKVSDDNITYSSYVVGTSQFAASLRYAKVKLTFTGADDKSAILISSLRISLAVKVETEEGLVSAVSTDVSGTPISFAKSFESIKALILVPQSTTSCFAVYSNLTVSGANIYVFDAAGVRISKTVSWLVRGLT